MGLYMYVSEEDRLKKRSVTDTYVNEEFQEALKCDPSLMIEERYSWIKKGLFKRIRIATYNIYHEAPASDGSAYQARLQMSASGDKTKAIAYLHGIANGVTHKSLSDKELSAEKFGNLLYKKFGEASKMISEDIEVYVPVKAGEDSEFVYQNLDDDTDILRVRKVRLSELINQSKQP